MIEFTKQNIQTFSNILFQSWSTNSSSNWTIDNPAKGQCSVTALVVQDYFGGEILKTKTSEGWHFYNRVNEKQLDFTKSQFIDDPVYYDILSNREEALSETTLDQYTYLKEKIAQLV